MSNNVVFFDYKDYFLSPESGIDFHLWHNLTTLYHKHNYYELILTTKGTCDHLYDNEKCEIGKGDFVLIPPGVPHQIINSYDSGFSQINVSITPDMLDQLLLPYPESFIEYVINKTKAKKITLDDVNYNFLHHLAYNQIIPSTKSHFISALKFWISSALSIVDVYNVENADEALPIWFNDILTEMSLKENLAKRLLCIPIVSHYSPTTLSKYFKKYLNTTPNEYFIKLKIKYACQLLTKTDYSTFEISGKIGYESLSHFNRIFKKSTGKTPSEYRKDNLNPISQANPYPNLF